MGTWAKPETDEEQIQAQVAIDLVKAYKTMIYDIIGDDQLFDSLDDAIKRIKELTEV